MRSAISIAFDQGAFDKQTMSRWRKGQSVNPKGRPKSGTAIAELARRQVERHRLIEKLGSIGAAENEYADGDIDQQLPAIQLLLGYGYGPPRGESEGREDIQIQVIYVETNHIAVTGAAPSATPSHPASETVQRGLLRAPLGQDAAGDGSPDPSGSSR
jgi:hypothetical protein